MQICKGSKPSQEIDPSSFECITRHIPEAIICLEFLPVFNKFHLYPALPEEFPLSTKNSIQQAQRLSSLVLRDQLSPTGDYWFTCIYPGARDGESSGQFTAPSKHSSRAPETISINWHSTCDNCSGTSKRLEIVSPSCVMRTVIMMGNDQSTERIQTVISPDRIPQE